jgi:hypothetical protein
MQTNVGAKADIVRIEVGTYQPQGTIMMVFSDNDKDGYIRLKSNSNTF